MHQEAVYLFCVLGQLEEAITVSLQFLSVEQAIKCLEFAQNMDDDKKKKLYLMIAEHVVTNENDIKQAMAFLQDCHGLVKVEDILPFFPDFVTIGENELHTLFILLFYVKSLDLNVDFLSYRSFQRCYL